MIAAQLRSAGALAHRSCDGAVAALPDPGGRDARRGHPSAPSLRRLAERVSPGCRANTARMIIGEDLGFVPKGFRAAMAAGQHPVLPHPCLRTDRARLPIPGALSAKGAGLPVHPRLAGSCLAGGRVRTWRGGGHSGRWTPRIPTARRVGVAMSAPRCCVRSGGRERWRRRFWRMRRTCRRGAGRRASLSRAQSRLPRRCPACRSDRT